MQYFTFIRQRLTGAAFGLVCAAGRMPVASLADSGYETGR
jgi:hypothetical protein